MKTPTPLLLAACAAIAAAPGAALATSEQHLGFGIHDILVTGPQPVINISVRNMAASTDPEDRDLRVTASTADHVEITGQVWCSSPDYTEALAAQIVYGQVTVHGQELMGWGAYSASAIQQLPGNGNLKNFQIAAPLQHANQAEPEGWFGGFNPVNLVENRLETFLENNAGSEADFLRVDDVFELDLRANAVGWCDYQSENIQGEYVGFRAFDVKVRVFYHGDPDIQDVITTVEQPGTVAAPVPNRARRAVATRGAETATPARANRPARATQARSGRDTKMIQDRAPHRSSANEMTYEACDPFFRRSGGTARTSQPPANCARDARAGDGQATPVDALAVINHAAEPEEPGGEATPMDALLVINHAQAETKPEDDPDNHR